MVNLPELPLLVKDTKLLSEVIAQLEKDLGESYPDLVSIEFSDTEQLLETVADILYDIHERSASRFHNLLYRIDVPENCVAEYLTSSGFDWTEMARLILKRELQKVVLRQHFSG